MILIVAYEGSEARGVANRMGLTPHQWKFVHEPEQDLRGTHGATVFIVDTAYRRHDYHRILQLLRERLAFVWFEEDYGRRQHFIDRAERMELLPTQQNPTRKV
jgi:hypothetical protein